MAGSNCYLEYEKIIWQIFYVGVGVSLIVLYLFYCDACFKEDILLKTGILGFGFAVLIYSFLSVLGYGFKKKHFCGDEKLNEFYVRTRWVGETIIIFLIFSYFISFYLIDKLIFPIFILLLFIVMFLIANLKAMGSK